MERMEEQDGVRVADEVGSGGECFRPLQQYQTRPCRA